jgi:orotate phosphoribosyltransferase
MMDTVRLDLAADRVIASDATSRQLRATEIFNTAGAFLEGHFTYTSGRHGNRYLEKFRILERADYTGPLCRMIAAQYADRAVDIVASPTTGGIILSYEVGRILGCPGIFCEKNPDGKGRVFRRGFRIEKGQSVVVVDDVVTTGGSLRDTCAAVENLGGEIIGVGVLADRSGGRVEVPYPYFACLEVAFESWDPSECPLCAEGDKPEDHRGAGQ